jgi:enediyne biosynthesis protein E4
MMSRPSGLFHPSVAAVLACLVMQGSSGLSASQANPSGGGLVFTDVTVGAGIRFKHNNGSFGKKYLPETLGSGAAFLDYDDDGWQDILLVNSKNFAGRPGAHSYPALYRNNRNGTFTDVTKQAGLAVEIYGFGVAAADYDNDGRVDVYITALGPNRLFRNIGGKFVDVSARASVDDPGFSTSAMWFDYDRDGKLDLFVANYVEWSAERDLFCTLDGKAKSYCTPESYKGQSPSLYRNKGDGTFDNITKVAGLYDPSSKALGVALLDFDADGQPDLFVANDTQPNRLYRNKGDGTFADVGLTAGVAFNEAGVARAGMGVDAADFDGSGRPSIVIGNFSNEMMALYANEGNGLFIDEAPASTIGKVSLLTLTFACFFFDFDLDGLLDIFALNGHVADDIESVQPKVTYAQSPNLFKNRGAKKFDAVTAAVGAAIQKPIVGRGAAYGDYDNDGDLDLLMTTNNGPARLLRNDGGNQNQWLRVRTRGAASNRDGIGTRVTVILDNGKRLWSVVKTGSSYCSQSELPLTFGLGKSAKVTAVEITWPNGKSETVRDVAPNQTITLVEGKGILRSTATGSR